MRRCLAILLLVLLPFQFSWAAVGTYCEHESGRQAQHFGHHEHEHRSVSPDSAGDSTSKPIPQLDVDCHFHCQCGADVPTSTAMPLVVGSHPPLAGAGVDAVAPFPSRPERPQWPDHA